MDINELICTVSIFFLHSCTNIPVNPSLVTCLLALALTNSCCSSSQLFWAVKAPELRRARQKSRFSSQNSGFRKSRKSACLPVTQQSKTLLGELVCQIKLTANLQWSYFKTNLQVLLHNNGLWTKWCILDFQVWHLREEQKQSILLPSQKRGRYSHSTGVLRVQRCPFWTTADPLWEGLRQHLWVDQFLDELSGVWGWSVDLSEGSNLKNDITPLPPDPTNTHKHTLC